MVIIHAFVLEQIEHAVQFLPICGIMIFSVDILLVIRNGVKGMGFPFISMLSGIAEMLLRIGAIIMFTSRIGFRATAVAEIFAGTGALIINVVAFIVVYNREKATNKNNLDSLCHTAALKQHCDI